MARNEKGTTLELDSCADTSILGRGALIIDNFNKPVNVQGCEPALRSNTYQTISGAIGYFHLVFGESFRLVIHQAINIPTLDHHMLYPMQCCVVVVTINDCPKFLIPLPQVDSHCIF